jgi:hypothetical protein
MRATCPTQSVWFERARWLDAAMARAAAGGRVADPGPQADALLRELEVAFCAGAWLATVILAQTVLDSWLAGETGLDGPALAEVRLGRDYAWLRGRRNALLHDDDERPAVTTHDLTVDARALERDARRAVELLARALAGRA